MIAALARLLVRRTPRERALLALLALGALPAAFVALVALPLIDARSAARAELAVARASRDWYAARQREIAALPVPGAPVHAAGIAPVGLGGIEAGLIDAGLREAVSLLTNAPNNRVALSLEAVAFDDLMLWASSLPELAGYRLFALRMTRVEPGLVEAELQLEPLP